MERRFRELMQTLSQQAEALRGLCELADRAGEALVSSEREAFVGVVREQEQAVTRMSELEVRRTACAARLARELGLPETSTLLHLCQALPEELGARLRELHRSMAASAARLSEVNRANDALVRQALAHTRQKISLLRRQATPRTGLYSPREARGAAPAPACRTLLNCQA
jgi:hypothetical protein